MFLENGIIGKDTAATLYNCIWTLILVLFFALFLPLKHLAESREKFPELWIKHQDVEILKFYVRKPELQPRREKHKTHSTNDSDTGDEYEAGCSHYTVKHGERKRSQYRRKRSKPVENYFRNRNQLQTIIEMPDINI